MKLHWNSLFSKAANDCILSLFLIATMSSLPSLSKAQFQSTSAFSKIDPTAVQPIECPIGAAKKDFDLSKFLGDWYVLEYEFPKETRLKDIGCVGLHFSLTGFGDVISNFTFRFPAKTGHFYHVPTFSIVSQLQHSVWETQIRGIELISAIVDTDYDNWAVLVQCSDMTISTDGVASPGPAKPPSAPDTDPAFISTRVLSRKKSLSTSDWIQIQAAIEKAKASAPFRYPVDQVMCDDIDSS